VAFIKDQIVIGFLHLSDTGEKSGYNETVHQLIINFKKDSASVRREVLYSILTEFGVPMELVRLIKMCFTFIVQHFKMRQRSSGRS
jgi:hypothetical protein